MTPIEKVARAIARADEQNGGWPYEKLIEDKHNREALFDRARAAVEALRDPSADMLQALWEAMFEDKFDGTALPMLGAGFEAAIDAALHEGEADHLHNA